jgi:hypothetical protein
MNEYPCLEPGCSFIARGAQGLGSHRRRAHGIVGGSDGARRYRAKTLDAADEEERMDDIDTPLEAVHEQHDAVDGPWHELSVALDQNEIEALDAWAFLCGVDRLEALSGLATEWMEMVAAREDVQAAIEVKRVSWQAAV